MNENLSAPLSQAAIISLGGALRLRDPANPYLVATPPCRPEAFARLLRAARSDGVRLAVLAGGELTLRKDLPALLAQVRTSGLALGLATDGLSLCHPAFLRGLLESDPRYLRVGLHGATPATHDTLAGLDGAFARTTEGLQALLAAAPSTLHVEIACGLAPANLDELVALAGLISAWGGEASRALRLVIPVAPGPHWPALAPAAERVAAACAALGPHVGGCWEGFPPCLLEGLAEQRDERLRYGLRVYGAPGPGAIPREDPALRGHPYPCQECAHEATCPGAPAEFLEREGETLLRPTRRVRANSFNYELVRTLPDFRLRAGDCTATRLGLSGPPERRVFLLREGEIALYTTPTADFTDAELRWIKEDRQQLYVDVSQGATLHDFYTGVRRARFHEECQRCPDRRRCGGALVVDESLPFLPEESWLRGELAAARGRVLDVGCGEQPYRAEIAAALAAGHIEYHGLDPDPAALARFAQSGVGGTLHQGSVEDFPLERGPFDVVMAFRSPNHFLDMRSAVGRMVALVRPGGLLYFCDSIAFGMLRRPEQVALADAGAPVGHEHYRNWSSEQLVALLARLPVRVLEHHPVTAQTANQWLVKAERVKG